MGALSLRGGEVGDVSDALRLAVDHHQTLLEVDPVGGEAEHLSHPEARDPRTMAARKHARGGFEDHEHVVTRWDVSGLTRSSSPERRRWERAPMVGSRLMRPAT